MAKFRPMYKVHKPYFKWLLVCPVCNTPHSWTSLLYSGITSSQTASIYLKSPTLDSTHSFFLYALKSTSLLIYPDSQSLFMADFPEEEKWPDFLIYIVHTKVWMVKMFNSPQDHLHSKRGTIGGLWPELCPEGWKWRGEFLSFTLPSPIQKNRKPVTCLPLLQAPPIEKLSLCLTYCKYIQASVV